VPRNPRLAGGVKGHNQKEISFPGSPALWAGSFTKEKSMIRKYSLLALTVLVVHVLIHGSCFAQLHKWGDENGNVHFSDDVSTIPGRYRANIEATESKRLKSDQTAKSLPGLRTYMGNLEPEGFGDIKWGTELSSLEALQYIGEDPGYGGIKIYIKVGDDLTIGGTTLKKVEYRFWKAKFCSARVITEGHSNFAILKEAAFELFGEGYKPNSLIERYFWIGNKTNITLDYDEMTGETGLFMRSALATCELEEMDKQEVIGDARKAFYDKLGRE